MLLRFIDLKIVLIEQSMTRLFSALPTVCNRHYQRFLVVCDTVYSRLLQIHPSVNGEVLKRRSTDAEWHASSTVSTRCGNGCRRNLASGRQRKERSCESHRRGSSFYLISCIVAQIQAARCTYWRSAIARRIVPSLSVDPLTCTLLQPGTM